MEIWFLKSGLIWPIYEKISFFVEAQCTSALFSLVESIPSRGGAFHRSGLKGGRRCQEPSHGAKVNVIVIENAVAHLCCCMSVCIRMMLAVLPHLTVL